MDNQFLSSPLLVNNSNKTSPQKTTKEDDLIKTLQLKNQKLRNEIYKIKSVIERKFQQFQQQKQTVTKRQSIIKADENPQNLNRQLANAYKKIKMYEYEINKMEEGQAAVNISQKSSQLDNIIKEKRMMVQRLKAELHKQQRIVNENTKKLANNSKQQEIERKVKTLSDEVKFLKQKLKDYQQKSQMKQKNLKKQYQFVKKLETQLLENGFSHVQLDEIKIRINKKMQKSEDKQSEGQSRFTINTKNKKMAQTTMQEIQQRTVDRYRTLQSEIKLLEKMQGDHEKQMTILQQQRKNAQQKNLQSRNKLIECQNQIEKLERQILQLKGKVIPSNMKPLRPIRSYSSQTGPEKTNKIRVHNVSINKMSKQMPHLLKYDQVGMMSDKGQRFTDRNILGKNNLNSKIIGMHVYLDKITNTICGFQVLYSGNKKGGDYMKKQRQYKQKPFNQQTIKCDEGDYFKSINGTLDNNDKLQSLSIVTARGRPIKIGVAQNGKKSFSFEIGSDQIPVCVYGAMVIFKQPGKRQYSLIEHFGVEINSQNNQAMQSSKQMQFS